jgi:hypothetical protein
MIIIGNIIIDKKSVNIKELDGLFLQCFHIVMQHFSHSDAKKVHEMRDVRISH